MVKGCCEILKQYPSARCSLHRRLRLRWHERLTSTTDRSSSQRALDAGLSSTLLMKGPGSVGKPRDKSRNRGASKTQVDKLMGRWNGLLFSSERDAWGALPPATPRVSFVAFTLHFRRWVASVSDENPKEWRS